MSAIMLTAFLMTAPSAAPVMLTLASSPDCAPSLKDIDRAIYRMCRAWPRQRHYVAQHLAPLIMREAKRRGLDPLVLLAVGSGESSLRPWVRGPRGEIGLWQLTFRDSPVDAAARAIAKEAPEIKRGHRPPGHWWFSRWELGQLELATFIVARELVDHVAYCRKHDQIAHRGRFALWRLRWWSSRWRLSVGLLQKLVRVAHYNIGPRRPLWFYLKLIATRYRWAYQWACERRPNAPSE